MSKIFEALEQEQRQREQKEIQKKGEPTVPIIREEAPQSDYQELENDMIALAYSIDSTLATQEAKVIQFIASHQGEGTSTLAQEFGRVSAVKLGKSVLLLNGDGNHSESLFADDDRPDLGKLELLVKPESRSGNGMKQDEPCFLVCPISNGGGSLASVFHSPIFADIFSRLKQKFDLILVDSPPVSTSSDGLAIVRMVDGVILVIEAEKTRWPVAESTKEKITKAGGNLLGVILNKRRYYIPQFIYNWI